MEYLIPKSNLSDFKAKILSWMENIYYEKYYHKLKKWIFKYLKLCDDYYQNHSSLNKLIKKHFRNSKRTFYLLARKIINSYHNNNYEQELNFASFRNANKGLASRTGILGLAGLGLGAATIGVATMAGAYKAGGLKTGMKTVGKSFGKAVVNPFIKLNPRLLKFGKVKTLKVSKIISKNEIDKNSEKINKTKKLITKFQNSSFVSEMGNKEVSKITKKIEKLQKRKEKYKIEN